MANLAAALAVAAGAKTGVHGLPRGRVSRRPETLGGAHRRGLPGPADDAVVSALLAGQAERFGHGSIIFAFACFSAGVPRGSVAYFLAGENEAPIEMVTQVAPLPRQLLGHPQGPVAFVGHVDRVSSLAFGSSFGMAGITPYHHFMSWLSRRKSPQGRPVATVGRALGTMREDARRVGSQIASALEQAEQAAQAAGQKATLKGAAEKWIVFHDYRGFILLGDPALTPPPLP